MAVIEKVSDITVEYLTDYLRIDAADTPQSDQIGTMLNSAIGFVVSYTGLPKAAPADDTATTDVDESAVDTLDTYPEIVQAVVVLVQNQYDNRTVYTQNSQVEAVLDSILSMHRRNLL